MSNAIQTLDRPVELGLADGVIEGLRGRLVGLTADTRAGYEAVRLGIAEVRALRVDVEQSRKELKKSAIEYGRKVDTEAKRVTAKLLEIEQPLKTEKARIDDEKVRLRREKEEAERKIREEKERIERERIEAEQRKQREANEAERKRLEDERRRQRLAIKAERQRLADERAELQKQREAIEGRKPITTTQPPEPPQGKWPPPEPPTGKPIIKSQPPEVAIYAYKLTRANCPGMMFCGVTIDDALGVLRQELLSDVGSGLPPDEQDAITIEAYETTQAGIDALPEFGGW